MLGRIWNEVNSAMVASGGELVKYQIGKGKGHRFGVAWHFEKGSCSSL